jgi:hypothetical protein
MRTLTMGIPNLRTVGGMLSLILVISLAGCQTAQQAAPANDKTAAAGDRRDEEQAVAEASLGKQAVILVRGDLAQNGREELLVVNPFPKEAPRAAGAANSTAIFVTRAAMLENNGGKWSQILLCDEHLKNPNGYLGGTPAARVSGWRLEYSQDANRGLEMKFTPAERFDAGNGNTDPRSAQNYPTFDVRWNPSAKRYQSYEQSQEKYLNEVPLLETPESTLLR